MTIRLSPVEGERNEMHAERDAVEWTRERWAAENQPGATHFAAMAAVLRTHQTVVAELDRLLKTHDLSRNAYLLMATLQMSRDRTRPLGHLSRHLMVHPTTVTLVIDQLEKRGLVRRERHPTDRRTVLATLTSDGLAAVDTATKDLAVSDYGLSEVSEPLAQRLIDTLKEVREHLGDLS